jgi:hypothetical protein
LKWKLLLSLHPTKTNPQMVVRPPMVVRRRMLTHVAQESIFNMQRALKG